MPAHARGMQRLATCTHCKFGSFCFLSRPPGQYKNGRLRAPFWLTRMFSIGAMPGVQASPRLLPARTPRAACAAHCRQAQRELWRSLVAIEKWRAAMRARATSPLLAASARAATTCSACRASSAIGKFRYRHRCRCRRRYRRCCKVKAIAQSTNNRPACNRRRKNPKE